jgi:RNA polymerase sigma factor (sigma-70 family)
MASPMTSTTPSQDEPDRRASEARLADYRPALTAFVSRRLPNSADVEDLVQEALARFMATADSSHIREPQAYLFRIARNLVTDYHRHLGRPATAPADLDTGWSEPAVAPDQEERRHHQDLQRAFEAALQELPPRCREVFILNRFDELPTWAIALRLRITPRMVQKHMANALTHLYARLGDHRER